jgi:pimeloyl-ACP methyl ester carboxylesterase
MSQSEQAARREKLYRLLGGTPPRNRPIRVISRAVREEPAYVIEDVVLDLNGLEAVAAYFIRPHGASGRIPAVLYNHSHGGGYTIGRNELLQGREYLHSPPYAEVLTAQGCAVLCIDHWVFGQRSKRSETDMFKLMLWRGKSLWGMMVYDSLRALDYLAGRDDVDATRLGTLGMSMGSTMAWWVAALDERVRVCVDLCCLTEFDALIETGGLKGHGVYYFVPDLLNHFSTAQINALIAPRAHLALAGNLDPLTPPVGLDRVDAELRRVYAEHGAPEAWQIHREDVAHQETPEMRRRVIEFLRRWL